MASVIGFGCDSVAEISFNEERIAQTYVTGFRELACEQELTCPVASQCEALIFSIRTTLDNTLVPGQNLFQLGSPVDVGGNFTAANFSISHAWLFEADEAGGDKVCTAKSDCSEGFTCLELQSMQLSGYYYKPERYCASKAELALLGAPSFTQYARDLDEGNSLVRGLNRTGYAIALAMDNAASLDGSDVDGIPNAEAASDPQKMRHSALSLFASSLYGAETSPIAKELQSQIFLMNGYGESGVSQIGRHWITQFSKFQQLLSDAYTHPSGKSPLWEATLTALRYLSESAKASYAKALIVFSANAANSETEDVLRELQITREANPAIALHVIELSAGREAIKPNADLYQLSRKSCASYQFLRQASQLPDAFMQLAETTASHWALPIAIRHDIAPKTWFRLAFSLRIELGDASVSHDLHRVQVNNEVLDKRPLLQSE
ncbi:MAG: hypothetical protein WC966_01205 [Bradymonadales bacterium]